MRLDQAKSRAADWAGGYPFPVHIWHDVGSDTYRISWATMGHPGEVLFAVVQPKVQTAHAGSHGRFESEHAPKGEGAP